MRIGAPIAAGLAALALLGSSASSLADKPSKAPSLQTQDEDEKKKKILNKLNKKKSEKSEKTEEKTEKKEEKAEEKEKEAPKPKGRKLDREEEKEEAATPAPKPVTAAPKEDVDQANEAAEVQALLVKLRKTRNERRHATREKVLEKWGKGVVTQPAARAELRRHARRIARLNRIKELAEEKENEKLIEKADELIEKENERHGARLAALKPGKSDEKGAKK